MHCALPSAACATSALLAGCVASFSWTCSVGVAACRTSALLLCSSPVCTALLPRMCSFCLCHRKSPFCKVRLRGVHFWCGVLVSELRHPAAGAVFSPVARSHRLTGWLLGIFGELACCADLQLSLKTLCTSWHDLIDLILISENLKHPGVDPRVAHACAFRVGARWMLHG